MTPEAWREAASYLCTIPAIIIAIGLIIAAATATRNNDHNDWS